jgi:MFS family permease
MCRRYVLAVVTLVYTLNFVDRGLVTLLLESIKQDLHLSDSQLGLLTGIAFGLFYATLGLPIARWADRGNRVLIISLAIGLWGGTAMLCLLIVNWLQLILIRVASGIGEAGCMPPTYSLLGDYFPSPVERTRAMTVYWLAGPLSSLVSFVVGGHLDALYGWRMTFFLMGLPAVLVAVVVKLTVVEPRQRAQPVLKRPSAPVPRVRDVAVAIFSRPSSRHLSMGIILLWTMSQGLAPWYAAFFIRSHGMDSAELGTWFGAIFGLGGVASILLGGHVAARYFAGDERAQMRFSAVTVAAALPCFALFLLLPSTHLALGALVPLVLVLNCFAGPAFALMQRLVTDESRATALATVMLLANLIGLGVGPQIVGVLSDLLRLSLGADSLRYAMLALSVISLWAAFHFWRAGETVGQDLIEAAHSNQGSVDPPRGLFVKGAGPALVARTQRWR